MRMWRSGSASPCQGEGREFESRHPLEQRPPVVGVVPTVAWPRGEAAACKAVHTGSNPVATSLVDYRQHPMRMGDWRSGSALP